MGLSRFTVLCGLALAACVSAPAPKTDVFAGYEVLRITDAGGRPIQLDVWYPTTAAEDPHSYNFGVGRAASGGAVAGDALPVVLLSHGAMGAAANYSWIAEPLARHGYVVLGVSHFGESVAFGPASTNPAAVSHFGDRTRDFNAALDFLVLKSAYAEHIDPQRTEQAPVPLATWIRALALMDAAVGPGFTEAGLEALKTPTLVIGAVDNDFLAYAAHAGRIGDLLGSAEVMRLTAGEGHFVFLDRCGLPIDVMGVKLCSDRAGVDREAVHAKLAPAILSFFDRRLAR